MVALSLLASLGFIAADLLVIIKAFIKKCINNSVQHSFKMKKSDQPFNPNQKYFI